MLRNLLNRFGLWLVKRTGGTPRRDLVNAMIVNRLGDLAQPAKHEITPKTLPTGGSVFAPPKKRVLLTRLSTNSERALTIIEGDTLHRLDTPGGKDYSFQGIIDTPEQASSAVALMDSYPFGYYRIERPTDEYLSELRKAIGDEHTRPTCDRCHKPTSGPSDELLCQCTEEQIKEFVAIREFGTPSANNT